MPKPSTRSRIIQMRTHLMETFRDKIHAGEPLDAVVLVLTADPLREVQFMYPTYSSAAQRRDGLEKLSEAISQTDPLGVLFVQNTYYRKEDEVFMGVAFTVFTPDHKSTYIQLYNEDTHEPLDVIEPPEPETSRSLLEGLEVFKEVQ